MKHSTGKPTATDVERFELLRQIGCIACYLEGLRGIACGRTEIHHLLSGNRRRGHRFTVPLGAWHHRGVTDRLTSADMTATFGPSLANGSKPFRERYGSDDVVLSIADDRIGVERIAA